MNWGAYVTVELQLFIFLPIIIWVWFKFRKVVVVFLVIIVIVGMAAEACLAFYYNFMPGYFYILDLDVISEYGIKPYTRLDSYAFGILTAIYYQ